MTDELEKIASELEGASGEDRDENSKPESVGMGAPKPKRARGKAKKKIVTAEDILPLDLFAQVSDLAIDTITNKLGVSGRSEKEKNASALVTRNLVVKYIPAVGYTEEIMFLMVMGPMALSILTEYWKVDGDAKQAQSDNGTQREREKLPS